MTTATYTNETPATYNGVPVRKGSTFYVTKIKGTPNYRFQHGKSRQTVAFTAKLNADWEIGKEQ